jgi:diguanylate cyclase (GGDEF)-like protein
MNQPVAPFEEPWPNDEMEMVVHAMHGAVAPRPLAGGDRHGTGGPSVVANGDGGVIEAALSEAGRRWAVAHQSASLMRSRLDALEISLDKDLDVGTEADRAAYRRAWRTVTDAATWTSLNQLEQAALLDPLTGVGNRRGLDMMLTGAMSGARRLGSKLVVVAIDLDGLKRINDTGGHGEGDRVLIALVDGIGEGLRTSDIMFRTGGDEFAIVLQGIGLDEVDSLMRRISRGDTPAFTWGAATLGDEHHQPAELLEAADADLYRRRAVERAVVGATAVTAGAAVAAGATGMMVDLHHPTGSIRSRISRRAGVAVAAGVVALGGAFALVNTFSPAAHPSTAIRPSSNAPSNGPTGSTGTSPATSPTTTPSASATSSPTGSSAPANASQVQLANVVTTGGTNATPGAGGTSGGTTGTPVGQSPPATHPTTTPPTTSSPPPASGSSLQVAVVGLERSVNTTVFGLVGLLGPMAAGL